MGTYPSFWGFSGIDCGDLSKGLVMSDDRDGFLAESGADAFRASLLSGSFSAEAYVSHAAQLFRISAALSPRHRVDAHRLVGRKYAQRGYALIHTQSEAALEPDLLTLTAAQGEQVLGTLSVRFDGPEGLAADQSFDAEMAELRRRGRRLCEFTRLAMDIDQASKRLIACLFHMTYLKAARGYGAETVVVEVNPRHVGYYKRMLGFEVCGEVRMNHRVNAPAVLMSLDFAHVQQQIQLLGGRPALGALARSLYPYAYSPKEEAALLAGLAITLQ